MEEEYENLRWGFFSPEEASSDEAREQANEVALKLAKIAKIVGPNEDAFCREMVHALLHAVDNLILPDGVEREDFLELQTKLLAARDAFARLPKEARLVLETALDMHLDEDEDAPPGQRFRRYLRPLLDVLGDLTGANNQEPRTRGRPKGSVQDVPLGNIMSKVFGIAKRHGVDFSFNKHKEDGGNEFREVWDILRSFFPEIIPDTVPISLVERIKWRPKQFDVYQGGPQ